MEKATWKTNSKYVDIDTGEELEEYKAKTEYRILHTNKNATYNATTNKGTVECLYICKKSEQLNLF